MSTINGDGQEGVQTPEQIVINGESYDPTEAQELLGKGKQAREFEKQWNSPIDSLASAYGKSQSELQAERTQRTELQQKLTAYEQKKEQGTETPLDTQKAREAARKLGFVLNDDLEKSGFIRRDDFAKLVNEQLTEREQVQKLISQADKLEAEINGEDGRPAFNKKVVLAYMNAYGIEDPVKAYEDMYGSTLKTWQEKQVAEKKNPSLKTFKTGGGVKNPNRPKITEDNLGDALTEVLG